MVSADALCRRHNAQAASPSNFPHTAPDRDSTAAIGCGEFDGSVAGTRIHLNRTYFLCRDAGSPVVLVPYGGYSDTFPESEYFLSRGILGLVMRGFIVVRPNTRGTADDSRDQGRYGEVQLQDTQLLLARLSAEKLIDPNRVALLGHSHGAAMVYYYMTHANAFCAGVAVTTAGPTGSCRQHTIRMDCCPGSWVAHRPHARTRMLDLHPRRTPDVLVGRF